MTKLSHNFIIASVALCMVAGDNVANNKLKNNKKMRDTFNKLLETVTNVNEERLDALKKFYELQNYLPKVGIGRTDENIVAVIIPNNELDPENNSKEAIYKGPNINTPAVLNILKSRNEQNNVNHNNMVILKDNKTANKSDILRAWKGCNKSAARVCKKACNRAYKEVCDDFKCSRSMKKSFKKACKRACNSKFNNDNDNDDYD